MATQRDRAKVLKEFKKTSERLVALLNSSPKEAIVEARALPPKTLWRNLRAMVLVDGGLAASDHGAVEEGAKIYADTYRESQHPSAAYNLANAIATLSRFEKYDGVAWYLRTAAQRRDCRALLASVGDALREPEPAQASRALTNLGNALDVAHRWVEAYEAYRRALEIFPSNGVASGCAARVLLRIASLDLFGHKPHMVLIARRLAHHAQRNKKTVEAFAGSSAVETFAKLPSESGDLGVLPRGATPYEDFVATNRLALSPIVEGLGHDREHWDDAHLDGVHEPVSAGASVPPLFAMFNVLKADYLVARQLLFEGLSLDEFASDTGLYFDTLDYASYGRKASLLTLAQRAALDLLDKIAVALNDYLALGLDAERVHFHSLWRTPKSKALTWNAILEKELAAPNHALLALWEIAVDLSGEPLDGSVHKGFLHRERSARNASTHRFVVLHDFGDLGLDRPRPTPAIEHHQMGEFERSALRTVQLVRAALLYFVQVVTYRERRTADASIKAAPMHLIPHHEIRAPQATERGPKVRRGRQSRKSSADDI